MLINQSLANVLLDVVWKIQKKKKVTKLTEVESLEMKYLENITCSTLVL